MTVAVTQGIVNALDRDARRRWETRRARELDVAAPAAQTPGQFSATAGRLLAMFGPDVVKIH